MSPYFRADCHRWGKGRALFMRIRHLILSLWIAESHNGKGDLLFGRRAVYRTGGAEVSDEPGVEQSDYIIERIHAILDSTGRDGYPLI